MASGFGFDGLREAARRAAEKLALAGAGILCELRPIGEKPTVRTRLTFDWHYRAPGHEEHGVVVLLAEKALQQAVPLPAQWRAAGRCAGLDDVAAESAERARQHLGLPELGCVILGQAGRAPLPEGGGDASGPGSVGVFLARIFYPSSRSFNCLSGSGVLRVIIFKYIKNPFSRVNCKGYY